VTDLIAFITARLDEDEHAAQQTAQMGDGTGEWRVSGGGLATGPWQLLSRYSAEGQLSSWHLDHIARHDPARVLRDVAAKRLVLEEARSLDRSADVDAGPSATQLFRLLALPYSDHPDYRQEWTP
jgi:hypothetical protein